MGGSETSPQTDPQNSPEKQESGYEMYEWSSLNQLLGGTTTEMQFGATLLPAGVRHGVQGNMRHVSRVSET